MATANQLEKMNMLYAIADTLQMKLLLRDQKGKFSVVGQQKFDLPVSGDFGVELHCKIVESYVTAKEAWVLMYVRGDLYAFLTYVRDVGELYFALVDGNHSPVKARGWIKGLQASKVMTGFGSGIVAMFNKQVKAKEWRRTDVIDSVDAGQPAGIEGQRGAANLAGGHPAPSHWS